MADAEFKIRNQDEIIKLLKSLPDKLNRRVTRQSLIASAKPIVKRAKSNLKRHRRTGTLQKSVKAVSAKARKGEVTVYVGAVKANQGGKAINFLRGGFYARFLEVGTSRQPARPWLRPALDSGRSEQQSKLAQEFGKRAIKEVKRQARKIIGLK